MPTARAAATLGVALALAACAGAPATRTEPAAAPGPGTGALAPAALERRLTAFAHDSMQGREAGTESGRRAAEYLADQVKRAGLEPAGENGGYLQTVPFVRRAVPAGATLAVGDSTFEPWRDFAVVDLGPGMRSVSDAAVVYGGSGSDVPSGGAVAGRVVVLALGPETTLGAVQQLARGPLARAAGIAVLGTFDPPPAVAAQLRRGTLTVQSADSTPIPALFVLGPRMSRTLVRPGAAPARGATLGTIRGDVRLRGEPAPGYNVVARLPGADPALRGQMVAFGAHLDHVGLSATPVDHDSLRAFNGVVRPGGAEDGEKQATDADWPRVRAALDSLRRTRPARRDSVRNGADDDGSGSIGLLAIADAFAASRPRPRRSLLFVWHTGEELGMVGSRWFTDYPTVPLDSVVAQLNVDMIGRGAAADLPNGGPGYVQLIGSRRLSTELGDLVERVNRDARHGFAFDYQFDANGHPAQYYCRSDHYMYARFGIPITFFSTGGHRDYHQLTDEVQYIDFDKLSRVSRLIHDVGAAVANLDRRPSVDKPKPDPNGECTQ